MFTISATFLLICLSVYSCKLYIIGLRLYITLSRTGVFSGSVKLLFLDLVSVENEPFTWKKTGENQYAVTTLGTTVTVTYVPESDTLTGSVSTGQFDIDIDVTVSGTATRA